MGLDQAQAAQRDALVNITVTLLATTPGHLLSEERILDSSGVSTEQLHQHFPTVGDLVRAAQLFRYTRHVYDSIAAIAGFSATATTFAEAKMFMESFTRYTNAPELIERRQSRVEVLAAAQHDPLLQQALGKEQQGITEAFADLIRGLQRRGWVRTDVDPGAIGLFIQAYTLGRVIDDISAQHLDGDVWNGLIDVVLGSLLIAPTTPG